MGRVTFSFIIFMLSLFHSQHLPLLCTFFYYHWCCPSTTIHTWVHSWRHYTFHGPRILFSFLLSVSLSPFFLSEGVLDKCHTCVVYTRVRAFLRVCSTCKIHLCDIWIYKMYIHVNAKTNTNICVYKYIYACLKYTNIAELLNTLRACICLYKYQKFKYVHLMKII